MASLANRAGSNSRTDSAKDCDRKMLDIIPTFAERWGLASEVEMGAVLGVTLAAVCSARTDTSLCCDRDMVTLKSDGTDPDPVYGEPTGSPPGLLAGLVLMLVL